jgi:hypothetical protein
MQSSLSLYNITIFMSLYCSSLSKKKCTMKKKTLALVGAATVGIATIVSGLTDGLGFFRPAQAQSSTVINSTDGQNTVVSGTNNQTTVNVDQRSGNFSTENAKQLVIQHRDGAAVPLLPMPSLSSIDKVVCDVIAGTSFKEIGSAEGWKQVEITEGACLGKKGWIVIDNIRYQ